MDEEGLAAFSPPRWKTLCQTVKKVSGTPAASTKLIGPGTAMALVSSTQAYSA